jgi:thioredoxin 1
MDRRTLIAVGVVALAGGGCSPPPPPASPQLPYNEAADARAEVEQSLAAATISKRRVLVIFGANWCEDCRALDAALKTRKNAELIAKEFVVVKVDVGRFDKNLPLAERYGNPIKNGIPAAVVVSPGNQLLYATRAGELSSARRMSDSGVYDFFSKVAATATAEK